MDKEILRIKNEVNSILRKFIGEEYLLFVFGSFVRGEIDRISDFDFAIYRSKKILPYEMALIREELNNKVRTLRDIDLVNLTEEVSSSLLANILKESVLWNRPRNLNALLKDLKKRLKNSQK